jgi:multidrug resistance efflux pump
LLFESELGPRFDVERWEETVEVRQRVVNATQSEIDILAESNAREQELSERRLAEAQSELAVLEAGSRAEDIQQRSAEVATLERSRDLLNAELEKTLIRAPITGTIATPFIERLVNRRLNSGDEIARLVNLETVTASLQVPEKEMADVALGSRVQLKARSYPSRDFEGAVDMVAPVADTLAAGRFVEIRTTLDNSDGALLPEMTGVAKIYAGRRLVFQLMTRRIVRWIRTEFWDLLP